MSKVILFRGKAATGKTTITDMVSSALNIPVLRKDDIYDPCSLFELSHSLKNSICYDVLAKIANTNIANGCDIIIDIALYHNPYYQQFLTKLNLQNVELHQFLCICSNDTVWRERITKRMEDPLPSQLFSGDKDALEYYAQFISSPLDGEHILDSVFPLEQVFDAAIDSIYSDEIDTEDE